MHNTPSKLDECSLKRDDVKRIFHLPTIIYCSEDMLVFRGVSGSTEKGKTLHSFHTLSRMQWYLPAFLPTSLMVKSCKKHLRLGWLFILRVLYIPNGGDHQMFEASGWFQKRPTLPICFVPTESWCLFWNQA